jgi:hypothetical protein
MTENHPITPPPELIAKWASSMCGYYKAARWGADQELEACCKWLSSRSSLTEKLRDVRRPKPPSLKEQALQALYRFDDTQGHEGLTPEQIADDFVLIRRALEQLDD